MRPKTSLALLFTITLLAAGAARADEDDPMKGHFTLEQATKGLSGSGPLMAKIETTVGTINCELFDKQAPITVANFVGLARGTRPFKDPEGTGRGNPGYAFDDEIAPELKFDKPGQMAMANAGKRDGHGTNGSQFFITDQGSPPAYLTGRHSIFGQCEPVSVVSKIANVAVGPNNRPQTEVVMKKVTISRGKAKKSK
jgi:peptidyl-prolyl cis-trans isomerase A (cyclophilin A)